MKRYGDERDAEEEDEVVGTIECMAGQCADVHGDFICMSDRDDLNHRANRTILF